MVGTSGIVSGAKESRLALPGPDAFSAYAAWGEQVTRMMAGRVIF